MAQAAAHEARNWSQPNNVFGRQSAGFDYNQSQRYDAFSRADDAYNRSTGSSMNNRFYEREIDRTSDMREARKVRDTVDRIRSIGHDASRGGIRRVNAKYGMDITQRYDAFGNNSFSSADNAWAAFFGAPSSPWKTSSYDQYDRHNYNLPDAYIGKNETLAQTIDELIYTDETFYTTVLLPFNFTDNLSIQWDKWEFNEHFTGIVPEQGVSRLVTSHRESRSESFIRRGLAAIFEHGFISTEEGRAQYFLTLAQIARAVQETTNFGVIYAFLTCHNYNKTWEERHGYFRKQTLRELLERECFMWAIAVKMELGLEKLDSQIVEWMNRYNVTADTWVLPPKPAMYLSLVPQEKIYYYLAGEEGPRRVNDIVGAGRPHEANAPGKRLHDIVEPMAMFKKNNVYLTRTYNVDRTGPIDLMTRVSSVGEYFKMVPKLNSHDCRNGNYMSCDMDRRIYDEDNDTGYTVTMKEALRYSQVFKEDGSPNEPSGMQAPSDANDLRQVFFLRSELDLNGAETFKPISFLGDIDKDFMGPDSVVNLAYTALNSMRKEDREDIAKKLSAGQKIIDRLASPDAINLAVNAAGAPTDNSGLVTWESLGLIQGPDSASIRDYKAAVQQLVDHMELLFGGQRNLFLNPANALPYDRAVYGEATPARVLYENVIMHDLVPLFSVQYDAAVGVGRREAGPLLEVLQTLLAGALRPESGGNDYDQAKIDEKIQKGQISTRQNAVDFYASVAADANGLNGANAQEVVQDARARVASITQKFKQNPQYTKAASKTGLDTWLDQMNAAAERAVAIIANSPGAVEGRRQNAGNTRITNRAVRRGSKFLSSGAAQAAGFKTASRFNVTQAADLYTAGPAGGAALVTPGSRDYNLLETPIMQGLIAAQMSQASQIGDMNDQYGSQFGVAGVPRSARADVGLEAFDDDYTDPAGVGAMFGTGAGDQALDQGAVDRLYQNARAWTPEAGAVFLDTIQLRFGNMFQNMQAIGRHTNDPLVRFVAALYYGAPWERQTLDTFYDNNIVMPCGFLGFRWGLYDMALGIKCRAGSETGATYFGHSDFMLSDDAAIKVHYGHYTHYGKSVVYREENVFVAYDIFPNKCLGGMGPLPYETRNQYNPAQQLFQRDIFYIMTPFNEKYFEKVMNAAGRFYTYMDAGMLDDLDPANRRLHYTTAAFYIRVWGWSSDEEIPLELDEPMYRINNPGICLNLWQGAQGSYNRVQDNFNKDIIRNKGPWGISAEGCRAARNGEMARMPIITPGQLGF